MHELEPPHPWEDHESSETHKPEALRLPLAAEASESSPSVDDDLEIIMRLLVEHTEKLRSLVDRQEELRARAQAQGLWVAGGACMALLFALVIFLYQGLYSTAKSQSLSPSLWFVLIIPTVGVGMMLATYSVSPGLYRRRAGAFKKDIRLAGIRLQRVVRVATQLADHSVSGMAKRLEIELQIAEALAVLSYAGLGDGDEEDSRGGTRSS